MAWHRQARSHDLNQCWSSLLMHICVVRLQWVDEITLIFWRLNLLRIAVHYPESTAYVRRYSWWRHQMETFFALLALCAGHSPVTGEFPSQRPVTRSFDVFFDLRLNKRLSKQSWDWWFETPSRPLWCHCNVWEVITCPCPWYLLLVLYSSFMM